MFLIRCHKNHDLRLKNFVWRRYIVHPVPVEWLSILPLFPESGFCLRSSWCVIMKIHRTITLAILITVLLLIHSPAGCSPKEGVVLSAVPKCTKSSADTDTRASIVEFHHDSLVVGPMVVGLFNSTMVGPTTILALCWYSCSFFRLNHVRPSDPCTQATCSCLQQWTVNSSSIVSKGGPMIQLTSVQPKPREFPS